MNLVHERVHAHLERLKLRRVAELLDPICEQASKDEITYLAFLERLLEAESVGRAERRSLTKTWLAHFPFIKTLADFDFGFQPSIDRRQVQELATLRFLAHGENVVFLGPPGVRKTHLAVALGTRPARSVGRGLSRVPPLWACAWTGCRDGLLITVSIGDSQPVRPPR